jgi:hypothetical protein
MTEKIGCNLINKREGQRGTEDDENLGRWATGRGGGGGGAAQTEAVAETWVQRSKAEWLARRGGPEHAQCVSL